MAREEKTFGQRARDWASFVMSSVAFVVSISVAFFTVVRQEDNISVVFRDTPFLMRDDGESLMVKWGELSIVLINNGNRPAVVSHIALRVHEYIKERVNECDGSEAATVTFETDFEPVVLKEKEVTFKKIGIRSTASNSRQKLEKIDVNSYRVMVDDSNKGKEKIPLEVCLYVGLSTPSLADFRTSVSLDRTDVEVGWVDVGYYYPDPPKPYRILRNFRTIFESD
jgi:hypothetical protein